MTVTSRWPSLPLVPSRHRPIPSTSRKCAGWPSGTRSAASATPLHKAVSGAKWHGGRLSQLRVPTLVLHGAQDPLLRPTAARRTAAAISGARLVILPGVGHYLPATVYPQVADEVRALADQAATAAPKPG